MRCLHATPGRQAAPGGFTLAEVLVATVLLALACAALIAAFGYESTVIQRGEEATVATYMAEEIRDMALQMDLEDVFGLDGTVFEPAVLSTGESQDDDRYAQAISVIPVRAADLGLQVQADQADAARMVVTVTARGTPVLTQLYYILDLEGVPYAAD